MHYCDLLSEVHAAAKGFRGGIEALAAAMSSSEHRVNPQVLRNKLVGNERHFLTLAEAESIMDWCDSDALAHGAARLRGGVFVKLPAEGSVGASDLALLELVTGIWRANGDVGRAIDETLADGRVEAWEVRRVEDAVYRMQAAMAAALERLKSIQER